MPNLYTEAELLAHDKAHVIPWGVWREEPFNKSASAEELQRTQGSLEDASTPLETRDVQALERSALCLLYGHPNTAPDALFAALKTMGCSHDAMYAVFAVAGRDDLLYALFQKTTPAPAPTSESILSRWRAYAGAARHGHLRILECFETRLTPEEIVETIKSPAYETYGAAVANNHMHIIEYIEARLSPEEIVKAITYCGYRMAAKNGHLHLLQDFATRLSQAMTQGAIVIFACAEAARGGHLHLLEYFETQLSPEQMTGTILYAAEDDESDDYAYGNAAENGHSHILEYFEAKLTPEQIVYAITAYDAFAYVKTAVNGHLHILQHFETKLTPEQIKNAVKMRDYYAWCGAARNGHLHILRHFETKLTPEEIADASTAQAYDACREAAKNGHAHVVNHLLHNPRVFAWAELHTHEYRHYTRPFAQHCLQTWRDACAAFMQTHPDGVFNLQENEAPLAFYVARYLIRENTAEATEQLRFLTGIPGVAMMAHQAITPNQPNELLRLALTHANQGAAMHLLGLTPVRELAEVNNFYTAESQGVQLDLRALAQDHESSMRALTSAEHNRLQRLKEHYLPILKSRGIDAVLEGLWATLRARYQSSGASITRQDEHGSVLPLPLHWQDFQDLNLSAALSATEYGQALSAYHAHRDHTALRWMMRPNPWLALNASFVYGEPQNRAGYSTFWDYKTLVALFWCAASDAEMPVLEDHGLEGRIDHFIQELALINRAHNWDSSRTCLQADGTEYQEEYDDGKGDNPSCYSGVLRRLFQSLIGHPLFKPFCEAMLENELREFVREHFIARMNTGNIVALRGVKTTLEAGDDLTKEQMETLKELNIPEEVQQQFIDQMHIKYRAEWCTDYHVLLKSRFALDENITTHVSRFWVLTDFSNLLQKTWSGETYSFAQTDGMFAASSSSSSQAAGSCGYTGVRP